MKKTALLLSLVTLVGAGTLASCNGNGGDSTGDESITLTFWTRNGTASYYTNLIEAFETAYPNIHVEAEDAGEYGEIDQKISQGIAVGNLPNLAITYPDYVAGYLKSAPGRVLEMSQYMTDPEVGFGQNDPVITYEGEQIQLHTDADDMIAQYLDEGRNFTIDGEKVEGQYELPLSKSTEMLFVNRTILTDLADSLGVTYDSIKEKLATWEGVWAVCEQLKAYDAAKWNGTPADTNHGRAPLIYEDDTNFYITLAQQLGLPYVDGEAENPVLFGAGQGKTQTRALLQNLATKYNSGLFVTGATAGQGDDYYATSGFANYDGAMIITTTAGLSWLNNYDTEGYENFPIDVLPMPASNTDWVNGTALSADANPDAVISQGPGVVCFSTGDEAVNEATWLFYKTITSDFLNAQWVAAGTYAPVRQSVYETETFENMFTIPTESDTPKYDQVFYPAKRAMYDVIETYNENEMTYTTDVFPGSGGVRNAAGGLLPGVINSENNTDVATIDSLIDQYYNAAIEELPL